MTDFAAWAPEDPIREGRVLTADDLWQAWSAQHGEGAEMPAALLDLLEILEAGEVSITAATDPDARVHWLVSAVES